MAEWVFQAATSIEAKRSPMRRSGEAKEEVNLEVRLDSLLRCLFLPAQSSDHCRLSWQQLIGGLLAAADEAPRCSTVQSGKRFPGMSWLFPAPRKRCVNTSEACRKTWRCALVGS